jgi:ABC-2 type transport system permease protein
MSADATGVIHDIGYQRYEGPRLGRAYAVRSLYTHALRTAYGFGRSGKAKAFPWIVVGIMTMVAVIFTVIRSQTGAVVQSYSEFVGSLWILVVLFSAIVAPELVSRDLRGGVLPLYFSRPLTRVDYALAKLAGLITAIFLLIAGPQTLMFVGGAFTLDGFHGIWNEFGRYTAGLATALLYACVFGALSLLVASLAGRRAVAAALTVGVYLVTLPIYALLVGISFGRAAAASDGHGPIVLTGSEATLAELASLASPVRIVLNVSRWWFGNHLEPGEPDFLGPYGPLYFGVAAGLFVVCVVLLLLRYRKVAR